MNTKNYIPAIAASFLSLPIVSANAAIIYDNGVVTRQAIAISDLSTPSPGQGLVTQVLADDFVLATSQNVTDVHWVGSYWGFNANSPAIGGDFFGIQICTNAAGSPGICTPLTLGPVTRSAIGNGFFSYSVDVVPFLVDTAVHWIAIYNNTAADSATDWSWARSTVLNGNTRADQSGSDSPLNGPWLPGIAVLDFQLSGVPEPGTLALLGLGLTGLGFSRRAGRDLFA